LIVLWLAGTIFIAAVLALQTVGGKYAEHAKEVWDWFVPNAVPTLSLMLGVFVAQVAGKTAQTQAVDRFLFGLALALSVAYLLGLALPIFVIPFVCTEPAKMVPFLRQSDFWLKPAQGLVTAALGGFFVSSAKAK
jgi:cytochrome c biogenesis protein CcdA